MVGVAAFAGVVGGVGGLGGRGRWVERGAPVAASKVLVAPSSDAATTTPRCTATPTTPRSLSAAASSGGCSPASHARNAAVREHRPAAHRRSARTASRKAARQSTRDAATRGGATASASARPNRAAKSARQRCGEEAGARHDAHADAALAAERNPAARHTRSTHSNGRSSHGAPRASTTTREAVAGGDPSGLGPVGSAKGAGRRARAARGAGGSTGGSSRGDDDARRGGVGGGDDGAEDDGAEASEEASTPTSVLLRAASARSSDGSRASPRFRAPSSCSSSRPCFPPGRRVSTAGTTRVPMNALTALSGPMFASGPRVGTWDARRERVRPPRKRKRKKHAPRARRIFSALGVIPPACGWLDKNTRV